MGKGWFGLALVCVTTGCSDDEPSRVPPEAGVAESGGSSSGSNTEPRDALGSSDSSATTLDEVTQDVVVSDADSTSSGERLDAATPEAHDTSASDAFTPNDNADAANTEVTSSSEPGSIESEDSGVPASGETTDTSSSTDGTETTEPSRILDDGGVDPTATDDAATSLDGGTEDDASDSLSVEARAGFIDVEGTDYVWQSNTYNSSSARLFYALTPADDLPADAPVFVFFNGGPGSATSSCLLSYGTGPYSLPGDLSAPELAPNPWSWTQMGNLLYFDTRQAGFSYSTLPDPSDPTARALEWTQRNFNAYIDAADAVRLVLRVLSQQPALRDNPIVIVGESYGGTRATLMLRYLLGPELLRTSALYRDVALADEITAFFDANLDDENEAVTDRAKRQLAAQILIQPFVSGSQFADQDRIRCLPDTPAQQVASEVGATCTGIEIFRDAYKIDEQATWSASVDTLAQRMLTHPTQLAQLLGVPLESINGLKAADRPQGYRDSSAGRFADPQPEFIAELGELQAWDAYHRTTTPRGPWPDTLYTDPNPCALFSWVAQQVDTFITNAKWDNVVLSPVLPTTLYKCAQLLTRPYVDGVEFASGEALELGETGQMVIHFNEGAPEGASDATIEVRGYDSGHMVTVTHAEALFHDVRAFLVERGVL